jgi:hypothetical protein
MLTCKQVSKALVEQDYERLPWRKKIALRLHVALCFVCGRYNRQVMDLQDGIRGYRAYEDRPTAKAVGVALSAEQKQKLKEVVGAGTSS